MVVNVGSVFKWLDFLQDLMAWGRFWSLVELASAVKMPPSLWERPGATLSGSPVSKRRFSLLKWWVVCLWCSGRSLTWFCQLHPRYHSGVQTGQRQCWYLPGDGQLPLSGYFTLRGRQHAPLHLPAHRLLFLSALWKRSRSESVQREP